ncbi:MAG: MBL fold metallo-hydrolase [Xanthomonadales bacterium]|nr:MBL fold metallo-hydrolase [Xanthomonadales bacterium]
MSACITAREYEGGIVAIDSGMVREGIAACYLLETDTAIALIEVGNNASAERILKVIESRGRRREEVSHVIVTHVHLDHAGGAGALMQQLPDAKLVVHPRGARHMIDPSRLEGSARAVYGDRAYEAMHGALIPVPEERVLIMDDGGSLTVGGRPLSFMDTPGHARHHFCVWDERTRGWFTGDSFGISYRELDTAAGAFVFPATTPVQFDPPALIASIERLMEKQPQNMYLTHFGRVRDLPRLAADMISGVEFFAALGKAHQFDENRTEAIETEMMDWLLKRAREHGVAWPEPELRETFEADVTLNSQGIEFWLDHS